MSLLYEPLLLWDLQNTIFSIDPYVQYRENPEGTQVISMNMGYDTFTGANSIIRVHQISVLIYGDGSMSWYQYHTTLR